MEPDIVLQGDTVQVVEQQAVVTEEFEPGKLQYELDALQAELDNIDELTKLRTQRLTDRIAYLQSLQGKVEVQVADNLASAQASQQISN